MVLSFLTGGVGGVLLYRAFGGYLMILAASTLFVTAVSAINRARHPRVEAAVVVGD